MPARRHVIMGAVLLVPLLILPAYVGLIADGAVPPPDLEAIAKSVLPFAGGALAVALGLGIALIVICAVTAPILFAIRSDDPLTIAISLVLTTTAIIVFSSAKSSIHDFLAVLIYLANMVLASMVYASHHLARLWRA
jgi:hypothetical protein